MKIESIIKRPGGTRITLGAEAYHFQPDWEDGPHIAEVTDPAHIQRLLSISEGFREEPAAAALREDQAAKDAKELEELRALKANLVAGGIIPADESEIGEGAGGEGEGDEGGSDPGPSSPTPASTPDVNGDGRVNKADAVAAYTEATGGAPPAHWNTKTILDKLKKHQEAAAGPST